MLAGKLALFGISPLSFENYTSRNDSWCYSSLGFHLLNHPSTFEAFKRRGLLLHVVTWDSKLSNDKRYLGYADNTNYS